MKEIETSTNLQIIAENFNNFIHKKKKKKKLN